MSNDFGFDKPFKKGDIIIYFVLFALVVALFILSGVFGTKSANGFDILVDGEILATYDFESEKMQVQNLDGCELENLQDDCYKITTKWGYNIIKVQNDKRTVKVIETDCGLSKECAHMSFSNNIIICAPHKLVIKGFGTKSQIVIG